MEDPPSTSLGHSSLGVGALYTLSEALEIPLDVTSVTFKGGCDHEQVIKWQKGSTLPLKPKVDVTKSPK